MFVGGTQQLYDEAMERGQPEHFGRAGPIWLHGVMQVNPLETLEQPTATSSLPRAPAPKIAARSAFLMNALTGEVYLSVNADTPVAMASTTKIMTALAAIQFAPSLDLPVTVGQDAAAMNTNGNSSHFAVWIDPHAGFLVG